jgi:hypothetical protein
MAARWEAQSMDTYDANGGCLCGAVMFETTQLDGVVGACHCDICRKWSGGPLLAVSCGAHVHITGKERLAWFRSSDRAERGFCSICGTHLFIRITHDGRYLTPPGALVQSSELRFDHEIFIDKKPNYYRFADDTRKLTGAEAFAGAPPQ